MAYNEGMSPADYAAVNGSNGGWGNGNEWWILLLLLFGWGGRGGFGGGACGANATCATPADVNAAVDQQTLISKLDQQTYGIADATYSLNNTIVNGFHGVDNAICNLGYNMQTGLNGMERQLADCCCTTQRAIDGVKFQMATDTCAIQNTIQSTTRDIIDNANCNTRAILDFMVQSKIDGLRDENQTLRLQASQVAQNNYLISQLRPSPIPAYTVANPYCCTPAPCGCGNGFGFAAG